MIIFKIIIRHSDIKTLIKKSIVISLKSYDTSAPFIRYISKHIKKQASIYCDPFHPNPEATAVPHTDKNPFSAEIGIDLTNPESQKSDTSKSRRKFMSYLLGTASGLAVAACGGGGNDAEAAMRHGRPNGTGTTSTTTGSAASSSTTSSSTSSSTTTSTSSTPYFYGLNGHMAYDAGIYHTMSAAAQLAMIKDLGATMYRCDVAGSGMAQTLATALKGAFANSGVAIMPVLNPFSAGWSASMSESAAYTLGYNLGTSCTTPLKGLVQYVECGNELDTAVLTGGDGSNTDNYSPSGWPAFRGVIRGMIDGVKAIDSTIKVGVNVGVPLAYRALQMLWSGITPDGSANGVTGAASVRWDITCYHWYESSGDITCGWRSNACYNVLQALKDSFGMPIFLTEWGWAGATDTQTGQSAYVTRALTEYRQIKDTYNIQSVMMYAMIDDQYGLVKTDGVTKMPAYTTFKNFVAANPV